MKKLLATVCAGVALYAMTSCSGAPGEVKSYNQGINVIPAPQSLVQHDGYFQLGNGTSFGAASPSERHSWMSPSSTALSIHLNSSEKRFGSSM